MPDHLYWKNVIPVFHLQPATFIILPFAFYTNMSLHISWDQDIVPRMRLDVKLPKVLSLEEIEKLINSATQIRNKAIIALLYSSGMRVGELVSLKPEDIYMSTMQVYISKGKNHRDRWTILSERAL